MIGSKNPLETRPDSVAIVALGPTCREWISCSAKKRDALRTNEVWVVNSLAGVIHADKVFAMDDLATIDKRHPEWAGRLRALQTPLITPRAYPEFPSSIAYPREAVCEDVKQDYFTNTVAYMMGYAILTQVRELFMFGCDFCYPGSRAVEPGAECVSYWIGFAAARGMKVILPNNSTLMDCHLGKTDEQGRFRRPMYGYDYNPGECMDRAQRGIATQEEQMLAAKSPYAAEQPMQHPQNIAEIHPERKTA